MNSFSKLLTSDSKSTRQGLSKEKKIFSLGAIIKKSIFRLSMSNIGNLQQISTDFYCIVVKSSSRSFDLKKNQPRRTNNKKVIAEKPKKVPILNTFEHSLNVPVKSWEVLPKPFEPTFNAEKCAELRVAKKIRGVFPVF